MSFFCESACISLAISEGSVINSQVFWADLGYLAGTGNVLAKEFFGVWTIYDYQSAHMFQGLNSIYWGWVMPPLYNRESWKMGNQWVYKPPLLSL